MCMLPEGESLGKRDPGWPLGPLLTGHCSIRAHGASVQRFSWSLAGQILACAPVSTGQPSEAGLQAGHAT
jgi:hypothetical protein